MAGKNKLKRFADIKKFPNVFEPTMDETKDRDYHMKGKWRSNYFKNDRPIVLELGCGKGEYSVDLGKRFPEKNFIGIDIKGNRIWVGAKKALDDQMQNVAFLRTRIDFIVSFFEKNEVDEIWITFPDPQPQKNRARKRLTSPMFIDRYAQFLAPGGCIHLKTDSAFLHEYTLSVIKERGYTIIDQTNNLYGSKMKSYSSEMQEILSIKTYYEMLFTEKGYDITYIKFKIN